jgi:NADPH:quinone reductase-like Zn-dependent oxidoreductase/acyl carrier protein
VDLAAIRARVTDEVADPAVFYEELAATGLVLGPPFQGVRGLWANEATGEILSQVVPPQELEHELERYFVHPALLDSVLQASSLGSVVLGKRGLFLPHRVRRLKFHRRPGPEPMWVYSRLRRAEGADVEVDLWALDPQGELVIEIQGFSMRLVGGSEVRRPAWDGEAHHAGGSDDVLYQSEWVESPPGELGAPLEPDPLWILLGDPLTARPLVSALEGADARARVVGVDQDPQAFLADPPSQGVAGLVHLATLDPSAGTPAGALALGPVALTRWVNAITSAELWREPRPGGRPQVWGVTAHTWSVAGGAASRPWGAPLWGAARVLRHEDPRLQTTLVDLGCDPDPEAIAALATWTQEALPPTELASRGGTRYAHRLVPADTTAPKRIDVGQRAFRAQVGTTGVLDSVRLVEARRRAPAPHEVEVEVRATALNFKDVVVGMGFLDAAAWEGGMTGAELGMDCAGVVTAVGSEVTALRVGDEVLGMAHNSLSSHVLADPRHMVKKRAEISFPEAASLSTVFLTAAVALKGLARVKPGETVLIHSAAGGVGSAAVQIAHELGARVIGTTSTQVKRDFLNGLGVDTIFNSRSAEFREHVLEATHGRGVDVVLNSLAGDAMTQGIRCLAPFGRFVEIGKLDLDRNRQIGLEPFLQNLSYHCLDLNRWVAAYLDEATPELEAIVRKTAEGTYTTAVTPYPIDRLTEALRFLAKGQHVGKVVVELPREGTLEVTPGERELFRTDGAYVVTGGGGGVGLEVACWLAEQGAGALLLLNRSGARDEARVRALRQRGVQVLAPPCDVGDPAALAAALTLAREQLPPLRGVFHLAMVLDDAPLSELTAARYQAVAHPKLDGAWHLHELTLDDPLEHFVGFSSIASVLGTPGQGNYAAANCFLDALAAYRRGLGLPATTLNYGVIEGAGVVARATEDRRRRILAQGVGAFDVARVLQVLHAALTEERAQRVAARVEWSSLLLPLEHDGGRPTPFSALARGDAQAVGQRSLVEELRATPDEERLDRLVGWFAEFLAQLSGADPGAIDGGASLSRLGVDSLMANQLLVWVDAQFGVTIPLVRLMQGPTVRQLAQDVIVQALAADATS